MEVWIHMQKSELEPVRHAHDHGRNRCGGGSGDVLVQYGASYPRDNYPCGDGEGQEEGRGTQLVSAHSHSGQTALSELKQKCSKIRSALLTLDGYIWRFATVLRIPTMLGARAR